MMKFYTLASVLATLLLSTPVDAQLATYTIPVVDGNTVIISTGTNALGVPTTATVSTVWSDDVAASSTGLSSSSSSSSSALLDPLDPITSSSSSSSSSSRRRTTTVTTATTADADEADPAVRPTTTTQRGQVGQPESTNGPPMRTTTYWYDPGDGNWIEATWTASNTVPPSEPTVTVPSGTVLDYEQYQTSVNRAVISNAVALDSNRTSGAAGMRIQAVDASFAGTAGWMAMAVGVVGMGWGVWAL